jgi:hypothetical protein
MPPGLQGTPGQPGEIPAGQECTAPQIWCNDRCVDPATDAGNCGGCMKPCQPGQSCTNGQCGSALPAVPGSTGCAPGTEVCNGNCVSVLTDTSNCGSCGNACKTGETCSSGLYQSWSGPWDGDPVPILMAQTGTTVTGINTVDYKGKVSGTTSGNPPKLTGSWTSGTSSGTFEIEMTQTDKDFMGISALEN